LKLATAKNNNNRYLTEPKLPALKPTISLPNDDGYGIDWVGFSLPTDTNTFGLEDLETWRITPKGDEPLVGAYYENFYKTVPFKKTNVLVRFSMHTYRYYFNFNPSTALYGSGLRLAKSLETKALLDELLKSLYGTISIPFLTTNGETGEIYLDAEWRKAALFSRVDVARNLFISEPELVMTAIASTRAKNQKYKVTHESKGWTQENRTKKAGIDRIYDKASQLAQKKGSQFGQVDKGWFRFESELKRDRLDKFSLRRISDLDDGLIWEILSQRWSACNWGVAISMEGDLRSVLTTLSTKDKEGVIKYLGMAYLGFESEVTEHSKRVWGKRCREMGLTAGLSFAELGPPTHKLDLAEGRLTKLIR